MWWLCVLCLLCGGCVGQSMQSVVRTLDAAHVPSCIRAEYRLRSGVMGHETDGVMVVYAAAGGATLAQCLPRLSAEE